MTRNLRIQLADLAEAWLRAARPDLSRERATDLISDWPLALPWDEETTAEVLSRFPAELVPVAGVHFLAQAEPKAREYRDVQGDTWHELPFGMLRLFTKTHDGSQLMAPRGIVEREYGPLVEVTAQPTAAPEVWDGSVPPGGFVCSVCRTPVESEPCAEHGAAVTE